MSPQETSAPDNAAFIGRVYFRRRLSRIFGGALVLVVLSGAYFHNHSESRGIIALMLGLLLPVFADWLLCRCPACGRYIGNGLFNIFMWWNPLRYTYLPRRQTYPCHMERMWIKFREVAPGVLDFED